MEVNEIDSYANSCNFCSRGKLSSNGNSLTYQYNKVFAVTGPGISVRFCPQCLIQLGAIITDKMIIEEIK